MSKELMIILAATWQTIFWRFRDHHPWLVPGSYSLVKFSYSISIHSSGSSSTGIVYISPLLWLCFDVNFRICIFLLHLSSFTSDFFRCQFDYFHCFSSFAFFFTTVIHKDICTARTHDGIIQVGIRPASISWFSSLSMVSPNLGILFPWNCTK